MGHVALMIDEDTVELPLKLQVGSGVARVGPGCAEPSPVP